MRVDLPAPFSPRRPWISPLRTARSTASQATTGPKHFVTPRSSSAGAPRVRETLLVRSSDMSRSELRDLVVDLDLAAADVLDERLQRGVLGGGATADLHGRDRVLADVPLPGDAHLQLAVR